MSETMIIREVWRGKFPIEVGWFLPYSSVSGGGGGNQMIATSNYRLHTLQNNSDNNTKRKHEKDWEVLQVKFKHHGNPVWETVSAPDLYWAKFFARRQSFDRTQEHNFNFRSSVEMTPNFSESLSREGLAKWKSYFTETGGTTLSAIRTKAKSTFSNK